jgi:dTDP-4-amino-4,6-dideoxygalactose transaminase
MKTEAEKKLEAKLCKLFSRKHAFLVGRGTTAISIALKALKINEGEVIIPSFNCPVVYYGVISSGLKPIFCDVDMETYNINANSLESVISKNTRAVIAVHMFGYPVDMERIMEICAKRNIYLIEDACQAMGGKYKGKKFGQFGDVSIFSFGYSKIIDGGGGGALLTGDRLCQNIEEEVTRLSGISVLEKFKNNITNTMFLKWEGKERFIVWLLKNTSILNYNIPDKYIKPIYSKLNSLDNIVKKRWRNTEIYMNELEYPALTHPKYKNSEGVISRYSVLVKNKKQRDTIVREASAQGIFISRLYKPSHLIFENIGLKNNKLTNSEFIYDHIINLMVDPLVVSESKIYKTVDVIRRTIEKWES